MATDNKAAYKTERRVIIKGWKMEPEGRREFVSYHAAMTDDSIRRERARIGERDLYAWQPHITEVIVEERQVTPWVVVDD